MPWRGGTIRGSALERTLEVDDGKARCPIREIGPIWLRRLAIRTESGLIIALELEPAFPEPVVAFASAGADHVLSVRVIANAHVVDRECLAQHGMGERKVCSRWHVRGARSLRMPRPAACNLIFDMDMNRFAPVLVALVLAVVGCSKDSTATKSSPPVALGAPDAASDKGLRWVGCELPLQSVMVPIAGEFEKKTGVKISMEEGGATRGIRDVSSKKADMGGACRAAEPIKEEQDAKLVPVAWDALVIVVHVKNPVANATLAQLRRFTRAPLPTGKPSAAKTRRS